MRTKIKVLIVDDQAVIRSILAKGLAESNEIEVVGKAADAWEARDKIVELEPDVITLDVEMPKMNGLQFLKKLMPQYPLPVVMVSSHTREGQSTTLEALEAGAVDFVAKPDGSEGSMEKMISDLIEKVIIASKVDVSHLKVVKSTGAADKTIPKKEIIPKTRLSSIGGKKGISLIAIGASTGGTTAIKEILTSLPGDMPGTVIVQHMPEGFTKLFAERLNTLSALEVKEAENGDEIKTGRVLIAPGEKHMVVKKKGTTLYVEINSEEKVSGHRPSVDVLFQSVAELSVCRESLGVILTGMGRDGASGLADMRGNGARTIGQDESSCVVYGMPREAFLLGGVEKQVTLERVADEMIQIVKKSELSQKSG